MAARFSSAHTILEMILILLGFGFRNKSFHAILISTGSLAFVCNRKLK